MGARPAHGEAAALQMACRHLQNTIAGAVVDGQLHADPGDGDIPHNARAGDVQRLVIAGDLLRREERIGRGRQPLVVGVRRLKIGGIVRIRHLVDRLVIAGQRAGLVALVDIIADGGI